MIKKSFVFILILLALHSFLFAQFVDRPVIRDSVYSNILKQKRTLQIILPDGYTAAQGSKISVLYITDGQWNTVTASHIENFLELQYIPQHILVGIENAPNGNDDFRYRDLTPTHDPYDPNPIAAGGSGGGPAFLDFITKELMPYINQKYANNGKNLLFGASLGGLFTMYAMLTEPKSFSGYLLADPSFWWNNYELKKMTKEKLVDMPDMKNCLFIAGRNGKSFVHMGDTRIDSVLREAAPHHLKWKIVSYDDETHNSMMFRTLYDGLKFIYWGYYGTRNLGLHPGSGFLLKDKPITVHCQNDNFSDMYYTMDGSVPTKESTPLPPDLDTVSVSAGTKLTLRTFCNQDEYSRSIVGDFRVSNVFPAVVPPESIKPGGLRYDYYLLKDSNNLAHTNSVKSGRFDSLFKMGDLPEPEKYLCVISGFLEIPASGYYVMVTNSWGASKVYLGKQLITELASPDYPGYSECVVPLSKGFYPVRVVHMLRKNEQQFNLSYIPPGLGDPIPISWKMMFAQKSGK